MNLVRTSLLNLVAVGARMVSMLALNKILAVYVGPAGYAAIGQLQNAVTALLAVASAGVNTGVTKYTAEFAGDADRQRTVWGTAGFVGFVGAVTLGLAIAAADRWLAGAILGDDAHGPVFRWVAACLVFCVLNALLLAILNGKKEIRLFVLANISNSIVALVITALLTWRYGLRGAMVSLAVNQAASCAVTLWLCRRTAWFRLRDLVSLPDSGTARKLGHYTLMAVATSVIGPLALMAVREHLIASFGADAAGNWEALTRISNLYQMVITTPLSVYYLPKLAELADPEDIRREMLAGYRLFVPFAAACALAMFLLRDWLIWLLFSADFLPMRDLFAWQMVGDVLRIAAWMLSFFLLSKAKTTVFIATEIVFSALFVALAYAGTQVGGIQGVPAAYAINYLLYILVVGTIVQSMTRKLPANAHP
jgi:polysaccharide transporter, PST family